jgi:hypothetical protein
MSERTFRAVVASVLVGALVLAILVVAAFLPRNAAIEPTPPATSEASTPTPTPAPTPTPTPAAWADASLVGVGEIAQGSESASAVVLKLTELGVDAIPDAPGSFALTLTDAAGGASGVQFVGTPTIDAPGSLGLTTRLVAPNVLLVSIVASDALNVEPITIEGLGLRASPTAALGPVNLRLGEFSGSLVGGTAGGDLPPVGIVIAAR